MKSTWVLEEDLLGVVEVLVPVVPLAPGEAKLAAGHPQVGLRPVPAVGADTPPPALLQHLGAGVVNSSKSTVAQLSTVKVGKTPFESDIWTALV